MKRSLIVLLILLACSPILAQEISHSDEDRSSAESRDADRIEAAERAAEEEAMRSEIEMFADGPYGEFAYEIAENASSESEKTDHSNVAGVVSPFAYGAVMSMDQMSLMGGTLQWRTGLLSVNMGAQSNLQTASMYASVIPVFVGFRFNLAHMESRTFSWTQYATIGAGPMIGVEYPTSSAFWTSMSSIIFRWGAGAYVGLGSEMRFNHGFGAFAMLEYDAYGFSAPLLANSSYFGPSFSFGVQTFF